MLGCGACTESHHPRNRTTKDFPSLRGVENSASIVGGADPKVGRRRRIEICVRTNAGVGGGGGMDVDVGLGRRYLMLWNVGCGFRIKSTREE